MGIPAPWENSTVTPVDVPNRPIRVTEGRNLQSTDRDGLELSDVERDHGASHSIAQYPTLVKDEGNFFY